MSGKFTVRILYTSGATIDVVCTEFAVEHDYAQHITNVHFTIPEGEPVRPLHLGTPFIQAVWQIAAEPDPAA
jgi:hypothetical protein